MVKRISEWLNNWLSSQSLKDAYKWSLKKSTRLYALAILVNMLLLDTVNAQLNTFLVGPVLSRIPDASIVTDLAAVVLFAFTAALLLYRYLGMQYQESGAYMFFLVLIGVNYLYSRVLDPSPYWSFYHFSCCSGFAYLDLLYSAIAIHVGLYCYSHYHFTETPQDSYYGPIEQTGDDLLGYAPYAEQIATSIDTIYKLDQSYTLGIVGSWGQGKTSFINLIRERLKTKRGSRLIWIDFNPWINAGKAGIQKALFDLLIEELRPYGRPFTGKLRAYYARIKSAAEGSVSKLMDSAQDWLADEHTASDLAAEIKHISARSGKKVVIVIDDLDRLDKSEILEVFKLVRNVSQALNCVIILAYDKQYIEKHLADLNQTENSVYYREKIVQWEITLPETVTEQNYLDLLLNEINRLRSRFKLPYDRNIEESSIFIAQHAAYIYPKIQQLSPYYRDIKKVAVDILLRYEPLKRDVLFLDYLILSIVRIKHPNLIEILKSNHGNILETKPNNNKLIK